MTCFSLSGLYPTDYWMFTRSLSGLSPFLGADNQETMANILSAKIDFDDKVWKDISPEAKEFITKLIIKDKK